MLKTKGRTNYDNCFHVCMDQVYLRFGAAKIMHNATLNNTVGGCEGDPASSCSDGPRYEKVSVDWKTTMLGDGIRRVGQWLDSRRRLRSLLPGCNNSSSLACRPRFVTLDVLVPSFRYPPHLTPKNSAAIIAWCAHQYLPFGHPAGSLMRMNVKYVQ